MSGLWHEVIASIYGTHPNRWDVNIVVRWSHGCPWKAIAQGFHLFIHHIHLMVGNEEKIRFWEDLWLGDQPLCAQYTDLHRVIISRNMTISMVLAFAFSWFCASVPFYSIFKRVVFVFHKSVYGQIFSLGFIFASYSPFVSSS